MFSNRSVSVQPSAPPIENAGVPEALIVFAAASSCRPGRRRLDPGGLERGGGVPDRRLVRRLEEEAVELALDGAERDPGRRVVLHGCRTCEGDRLQHSAVREVPEQARLADRGQVRRLAALDRRREDRRRVVAARRVLDLDVRIQLLEAVEDGLEPLLLGAGPDPDDREVPRDRLVLVVFVVFVCDAVPTAATASAVTQSAATARRNLVMRPPSVWAGRRSRDRSRDRRSGACACRRRPPRRRPRARASVRRSGRRSVVSVTPSSRSCATTASMSSASSRTSSVRAGLASTCRCTMTSEPRDSRSRTVPFSRRSAGVSGASAASSRCSGRIPRITVEPRYASSAGWAATVSSSSAIECEPAVATMLAVAAARASPPACSSPASR